MAQLYRNLHELTETDWQVRQWKKVRCDIAHQGSINATVSIKSIKLNSYSVAYLLHLEKIRIMNI